MTKFPWKPREWFWQDLLILMLPQPTSDHGNRMSDFKKRSLFLKKNLRKSILAIICLNFTFLQFFLVNKGHRTITGHVRKVQYWRAGHSDITSE